MQHIDYNCKNYYSSKKQFLKFHINYPICCLYSLFNYINDVWGVLTYSDPYKNWDTAAVHVVGQVVRGGSLPTLPVCPTWWHFIRITQEG